METLKFKTNIKCSGCVSTVTPALNSLKGVTRWDVDTANPDKLLFVNAENLSAEDIIHAIESKGYQAEAI